MIVVSFCLYGPECPLYSEGLLENIALIGHHFPTWLVYVYVAPDVPESFLDRLRVCSSVRLRLTNVLGAENKTFRFFAIDEPDVDTMFVRDTDSRIGWRDRWAMQQFLSSSCVAHTIRDNPEHTAPLLGGLWALTSAARLSLRTLYEAYPHKRVETRYCSDQNFLADCVYPKVRRSLLVHHGAGVIRPGEHVVSFPFPWSEDTYCGRVQHGPFLDTQQPRPTPKPWSILRLSHP